MARLNSRALHFIPVATNFSKLKQQGAELQVQDDYREKFQTDRDYELLICNMLYNLSDREKVAFLFLILKNDGYQIDNESAAKALNIPMRTYMTLTKKVKQKFHSYLVEIGKLKKKGINPFKKG